MACNMDRLANFTAEKQQLIALGIDTYTGDVSNFAANDADTSPKSMDQEIRDRFTNEVMHGEKFNYRTFRKYKNDIYEIIEETLDQTLPEGWSDNEFMNRFVEVKRVDLGDEPEFYAEDNSLLVVSNFSGNHWDTIRERMDLGATFKVATSWWVVHFYNEFERFMKNIDSFSRMLDKVRKSFLQQFQDAIYVAFSNLADSVPEGFYGHGALSTDSERDALLELIDKVDTGNNTQPVIVGTGAALRKLQKNIEENWIADSAKEERKRNGVISSWEGYDLLPLKQVFKAGTFDFALSNTRLLIVSGYERVIKFVYEGDARIKDVTVNTENQDQTIEHQVQVKAGIATVASAIMGLWELA